LFFPWLFTLSPAAAAGNPPSPPALFAAEIADKNVAARGGLQAWKAVQTMTLDGRNGRRRQSASHSYDANVRQKEKRTKRESEKKEIRHKFGM